MIMHDLEEDHDWLTRCLISITN